MCLKLSLQLMPSLEWAAAATAQAGPKGRVDDGMDGWEMMHGSAPVNGQERVH